MVKPCFISLYFGCISYCFLRNNIKYFQLYLRKWIPCGFELYQFLPGWYQLQTDHAISKKLSKLPDGDCNLKPRLLMMYKVKKEFFHFESYQEQLKN